MRNRLIQIALVAGVLVMACSLSFSQTPTTTTKKPVATKTEASSSATKAPKHELIDLNSATKEQLMGHPRHWRCQRG